MTAYGRAKEQVGAKNITVELKSVNNRYLDCQVKISRAYSFLEEKVKGYIQSAGISRGKLDVYIGVELTESEGTLVTLDEAYTESYIAALKKLRDSFGLADDISVMGVAANRDIFTVTKAEEDAEKDWEEIRSVLDKALAEFVAYREREGERLHRDLAEKKAHLMELVSVISARSAEVIAGYRDRLEAKLKAVLDDNKIDLNEQRILTECAIFADKVAIDEELVRLGSHFVSFDEMFEGTEPVGRKLDFLLQEMNRETNTIGSKAQDSDIAKVVIEMKNELEKIREQIQNLE